MSVSFFGERMDRVSNVRLFAPSPRRQNRPEPSSTEKSSKVEDNCDDSGPSAA